MSNDYDETKQVLDKNELAALIKGPVREDALINSLQIQYYIKNIHKENSKFKLMNNGEFDNRIFYNLSFMIAKIEDEFNVDLKDQCVNVPRNWREVIDFRCSIARIKSFLNKQRKMSTTDKSYTIFIYESKNSEKVKIIFELDPAYDNLKYCKAIDKCNSRYLKAGYPSRYKFRREFCRVASEEESIEYLKLKKEKLK